MIKKERNRKTIRVSDETNELLENLKELYGQSENSIIERSIHEFASDRPNTKLSMEKRLNRMEEQLFHLMNMCNSICTSLNIKSDEYASAENRPSEVLNNSENDLNIYMMRLKGKI